MNELLNKVVNEFTNLKINLYSEEGKKWARDNDLDVTSSENIEEIKSFFNIVKKIGCDDKYITDKFLIRNLIRCNSNSYFISLLLKYDIKEVVVTNETNVYIITSLLSKGYTLHLIEMTLTDKWGKDNFFSEENQLYYGHGLLLKRD